MIKYHIIPCLLATMAALIIPNAALSQQAAGGKNLLLGSDNFNDQAWLGFSKNATITSHTETAPDNSTTAAKIVVKGGFLGQIIKAAEANHTYVFSVWLKSATGSPITVTVGAENNTPNFKSKFEKFNITGEWQRFSVALPCPAEGNKNFRFSLRDGEYLAWHPQVEDVTGKDSQAPTDYESKAGSSIPVIKAVQKKPIRKPANGVQNIACWGDSLTAGAGSKAYPTVLQDTYPKVKVFNGGVGGETSIQIKKRFMEGSDKWGDITVIWAGRNNYDNPQQVENDIALMISELETKRFLVLGVLNMSTEIKDSGAHKIISKINSDLASLYPNNFIDMRKILVEAYDKNSPEDVQDHENDTPPASLRSDKIHLNAAGYKIVAEKVNEFFKSKNWLTDSDKGEE